MVDETKQEKVNEINRQPRGVMIHTSPEGAYNVQLNGVTVLEAYGALLIIMEQFKSKLGIK
jgi:hypothetical protein